MLENQSQGHQESLVSDPFAGASVVFTIISLLMSASHSSLAPVFLDLGPRIEMQVHSTPIIKFGDRTDCLSHEQLLANQKVNSPNEKPPPKAQAIKVLARKGH